MDYIKSHGFSDTPICDCHIHPNRPYPIEENSRHLMTLCRFFNLSRVLMLGLLDLTYPQNRDPSNNATLLYLKSALSPKAYAFAGFMHNKEVWDDKDGCKNQAIRFFNMGFDGIKMIEGKPDRYDQVNRSLDDEKYESFYAWAQENNFPILIHIGDPNHPKNEALRGEFINVLKKHPKLTVIIAHFFFLEEYGDDAARIWGELFDKYENLYTDLSMGGGFIPMFSKNIPLWHEFLTKYQDRIIFGSDSYPHYFEEDETVEDDIAIRYSVPRNFFEGKKPFTSPLIYLNEDKTPLEMSPVTDLDKTVTDKIFKDNFVRLLGERPRELNIKLVADYVDELILGYSKGELFTYQGADAMPWFSETEKHNLLNGNELAKENLEKIKAHFKGVLKFREDYKHLFK